MAISSPRRIQSRICPLGGKPRASRGGGNDSRFRAPCFNRGALLKCTEPRCAMTAIEYKGHRIEVSPVGKGWRAAIFAPGSTRAIADSPSNLEKSRSEEIVAEAKRIIVYRTDRRGKRALFPSYQRPWSILGIPLRCNIYNAPQTPKRGLAASVSMPHP